MDRRALILSLVFSLVAVTACEERHLDSESEAVEADAGGAAVEKAGVPPKRGLDETEAPARAVERPASAAPDGEKPAAGDVRPSEVEEPVTDKLPTAPGASETGDGAGPAPLAVVPVEGVDTSAGADPSLPEEAAAPSEPRAALPLRPISFAPLVSEANPSVVNIYTKMVVRARPRHLDPFFHFAPRERISESLGTGFIIDKKGLVMTNNHVIAGAAQIRVRTVGGEEFSAKVVGADPATDLAVIQLEDAPELTPLPLGDSDKALVGDWVVAIGNALGLSSTVTVGIISAKGRSEVPLGGQIRYMDFIQTDASINPGNSGGPLINLSGEVVGINTAINREGQGIGFAIPINMARVIVEPLIREGKVTRSWLGIYVAVVNEEIASRAGLPAPTGAMVHRIIAKGPADKAGFVKGDIILEFDGAVVKDTNDLRLKSSLAGIGRQVKVKVRRGGADVLLNLVLARSPHE